MSRLVATWHAGRLLQSIWTYRLAEDDGAYRLDCKAEHEPDSAFAEAHGHLVAHRVAAELIALDRERCAAEELAYLEDERREKVTDIETGRRTG